MPVCAECDVMQPTSEITRRFLKTKGIVCKDRLACARRQLGIVRPKPTTTKKAA